MLLPTAEVQACPCCHTVPHQGARCARSLAHLCLLHQLLCPELSLACSGILGALAGSGAWPCTAAATPSSSKRGAHGRCLLGWWCRLVIVFVIIG